MARSGYCNLLQPTDRRSRTPGDSAEAVAARRRLSECGGSAAAFLDAIAAARPPHSEAILDVGCGDGFHLAQLAAPHRHGIDISVAAIDAAAKRYRDCCFFVANADRFVPYADASFDLILSITARMNSAEFRRVVRDDGHLLVAVAAPDDLIELRAAILGNAEQRDRTETAIATFANDFTLIETRRSSVTQHLDREAIRDVMTSSYRAMRTREREKLAAIDALDVTFSRDLLLFAPARRGTPRGSSA